LPGVNAFPTQPLSRLTPNNRGYFATNSSSGSGSPKKNPSGNSNPSVDFNAKPKSGPGPRAKADARKAAANRAGNSKAGNSQSGGSPFTEAFTVEPKFPARPGQNRDGLFGRFSARPTPDPSNPGCAGGPRSITVLSGQLNSDSSTKLTAYDGLEAKLTDKSENHLTSKHGHKFGVDDPLTRNPNQKPTKYEQTRTRLNN